MGATLQKAVETLTVERHGGPLFRVGMAEMNGFRKSMEDAHVIVTKPNWGFFGVFDGHGGSSCSTYVAKRLTELLTARESPPEDDATIKKMMLDLDQEFLDTKQQSGSTGTFVFVEPEDGQKHVLRVGNIGDSRVLLGHLDGSIFEGPGTDSGLTTDHKPDYPSERERIYRTGGYVELVSGVARVNSDLAVSRAFGDGQYKRTGGPAPEDHPVSAEPEMGRFEAGPADFLLLVCDGISEAAFPNKEVVELAAEVLRKELEGGKAPDLGKVAVAVCKRALASGSMDNLSCMIVMLSGGEVEGPAAELIPGPFGDRSSSDFREAYAAMAKRGGCTLAEALEMRYDAIRKERVEAIMNKEAADSEEALALRKELALFGEGPPTGLIQGSDERRSWFQDWVSRGQQNHDLSGMARDSLRRVLAGNPAKLAEAVQNGWIIDITRPVEVAEAKVVQESVTKHPALQWDERLQGMCGQKGQVLQDDPNDNTSQVVFVQPFHSMAWLPTEVLHDLRQQVLVAEVGVLREFAEQSSLRWTQQMESVAGLTGFVLREDDSDDTAEVEFPQLKMSTWLPRKGLRTDPGDGQRRVGVRSHQLVMTAGTKEELKAAVDAHPNLRWHDRLNDVVACRGRVVANDDSDQTSQVAFSGLQVWLPNHILTKISDPSVPGSVKKPLREQGASSEASTSASSDSGSNESPRDEEATKDPEKTDVVETPQEETACSPDDTPNSNSSNDNNNNNSNGSDDNNNSSESNAHGDAEKAEEEKTEGVELDKEEQGEKRSCPEKDEAAGAEKDEDEEPGAKRQKTDA